MLWRDPSRRAMPTGSMLVPNPQQETLFRDSLGPNIQVRTMPQSDPYFELRAGHALGKLFLRVDQGNMAPSC